MAVAPMKRGRAVVWLPPRSDGERAFGSEAHLLAFRGGQAAGSAIEKVSLDGLTGTTQVQLVFDARDVTLLMPEVPMLSGARLAQAVPNIVEDSLLQDAASCAFVIGPPLDSGRRLIAVIDRAWLEFTVGAFERRGMKARAAWPAQLTLPWRAGSWSIGGVRGGIALRTGPLQGLGWGASDDVDLRTESVVGLLEAAMAGGDRPESLSAWVDNTAWHAPIERAAARLALPLEIASIAPPEEGGIDLLSGRVAASRRMLAAFDVRAWRVPMAIAGACLLSWLIGLNLHWIQMGREKDALRRSLESTFRGAFPTAQVVVDPLLQMNRQVADLRARSGQSGPDDFVPLMAQLGQALGPAGTDAIAGAEYREGRLKVRFQTQRVDGRAAREALRDACAKAGLTLQFDNERDPTAVVGVQR